MSYETLQRSGRIRSLGEVDRRQRVAELLRMGEQRLRDAQVSQLSLDLQHNIAYEAARLAAEALMAAEGYRSGHSEGHHAAVFDFLAVADGTRYGDRAERFHQARRLRNKTTYEQAGLVSEITSTMMRKHARLLLDDVRRWIAEHHPEFAGAVQPGNESKDET